MREIHGRISQLTPMFSKFNGLWAGWDRVSNCFIDIDGRPPRGRHAVVQRSVVVLISEADGMRNTVNARMNLLYVKHIYSLYSEEN